jgi:CBS domain-containing protein
MQVSEGMTPAVVTVGPSHTLRAAAQAMSDKAVGAAIVIDPDQPAPQIVTERDLLRAVGGGLDVDKELVSDHFSAQLTFAAPDWSLERAADVMVRGGFRHLIVVDGADIAGVLSMRDIVRAWIKDGASCELT